MSMLLSDHFQKVPREAKEEAARDAGAGGQAQGREPEGRGQDQGDGGTT